MFTVDIYNFLVELLLSNYQLYNITIFAVDNIDYLYPKFVQPNTFLGYQDALYSY